MTNLEETASIISEEAGKEFPDIDIKERLKATEERLKRGEELLAKGRELIEESQRILEELPSTHELLFHFGIEEAGSPGAVLDEAAAKASPCSCFTYKGKDLCWSKGIIGMLTQDQQKLYCIAGKTYKAQPALTERYDRFAEAAEEAHKKIEAMPKGMPRLEVWLGAMGTELSKRGIEV